MNPKTFKDLTPQLNRENIATHTADLIISSVIALFIVTTIILTTGLDNIASGLRYQSITNPLSIIQSFDKIELEKSESILLGLSIFLGISLLTTVLYSIFHSIVSNKVTNENHSRKIKYQNYFSGVVSDKYSSIKLSKKDQVSFEENKEHLSIDDLINVNNRMMLLKELKDMYNLISGEEKKRLKELYYALGFIDDLPNKFKSPDWVHRVEAIHEVKQFEVRQYYPVIFKLVNDSNKTVKRNSILARIDLEDKPLDILKDLNEKMSIWEKHNFKMLLDKLPNHRIPRFQDLIIKYPIHQEFLSEMKTHFNQGTKNISLATKAKLHVV